MSRSFKKNPIMQDGRSSRKWIRTLANRKVRRKHNWNKASSNPGSYKRLYEQWSICDHRSRQTLKDVIEKWYDYENWCMRRGFIGTRYDETLEEAIHRWRKFYYIK